MKTFIISLTLITTSSFAACGTEAECLKLANKEINQGIKYKCIPEAQKALETLENNILGYNSEELKACVMRSKDASKFTNSIARLKKKLANVK